MQEHPQQYLTNSISSIGVSGTPASMNDIMPTLDQQRKLPDVAVVDTNERQLQPESRVPLLPPASSSSASSSENQAVHAHIAGPSTAPDGDAIPVSFSQTLLDIVTSSDGTVTDPAVGATATRDDEEDEVPQNPVTFSGYRIGPPRSKSRVSSLFFRHSFMDVI